MYKCQEPDVKDVNNQLWYQILVTWIGGINRISTGSLILLAFLGSLFSTYDHYDH